MKLHIMSDVHLEFSKFQVPKIESDVVILAGDVGLGSAGVHWAREAFCGQPVIYVPGNHEFYKRIRIEVLRDMHASARGSNVHVLDNEACVIGDVRFLGATLWTDFKLYGDNEKIVARAMSEGEKYLADFRLIHEQGVAMFSAKRSAELHAESLKWLESRLAEPFAGKTVVVTHHLPSLLSVPERFADTSACFASRLDHLFGKMDLWIHGHTHDNFDYVSSGTRVVCNPRGYVTMQGLENCDFNPRFVVEV